MMFRRKPPAPRAESNEARLRALGYLLDQHGYVTEGLCILEVGGGFEVTGLRVPARGAAYDLTQQTVHIPASELTTTLQQRAAQA